MFNFFDEIKKELKLEKFDEGYEIVDIGGKVVYVEGHLELKTGSKYRFMM